MTTLEKIEQTICREKNFLDTPSLESTSRKKSNFYYILIGMKRAMSIAQGEDSEEVALIQKHINEYLTH